MTAAFAVIVARSTDPDDQRLAVVASAVAAERLRRRLLRLPLDTLAATVHIVPVTLAAHLVGDVAAEIADVQALVHHTPEGA